MLSAMGSRDGVVGPAISCDTVTFLERGGGTEIDMWRRYGGLKRYTRG